MTSGSSGRGRLVLGFALLGRDGRDAEHSQQRQADGEGSVTSHVRAPGRSLMVMGWEWERVPSGRASVPAVPVPSSVPWFQVGLDPERDALDGEALNGDPFGFLVRGRRAVPGLGDLAPHGLDVGDEPAAGLLGEVVGLPLVAVGVDGLDGDPGRGGPFGLDGKDGVALARPRRALQVGGEGVAAPLVHLALEPLAERAAEAVEVARDVAAPGTFEQATQPHLGRVGRIAAGPVRLRPGRCRRRPIPPRPEEDAHQGDRQQPRDDPFHVGPAPLKATIYVSRRRSIAAPPAAPVPLFGPPSVKRLMSRSCPGATTTLRANRGRSSARASR